MATNDKTAPSGAVHKGQRPRPGRPESALAGLEPRVTLVDDIKPPLPVHNSALFVPAFHRLQRIDNLHGAPPPPERATSDIMARNIGAAACAVKCRTAVPAAGLDYPADNGAQTDEATTLKRLRCRVTLWHLIKQGRLTNFALFAGKSKGRNRASRTHRAIKVYPVCCFRQASAPATSIGPTRRASCDVK